MEVYNSVDEQFVIEQSLHKMYYQLKSRERELGYLPFEERKKRLQALLKLVKLHEDEIITALKKDFSKPEFETRLAEIGPVINEIQFQLKNLKKWMKPKKVKTPWSLWGSQSYVTMKPLGLTLIIAPWNYPFGLLMKPLVHGIAAGNLCVVKPSEKTPHMAILFSDMFKKYDYKDEVRVANGGVFETECLLKLPFAHIFFTGSTSIGKIIMEKASRHLSKVTLELGGKSPVIMGSDYLNHADFSKMLKKIFWGKFFNAGQTCVAPDYLLVPKILRDDFLRESAIVLKSFFGDDLVKHDRNPYFSHIVSEHHFQRLWELTQDALNRGARAVEISPGKNQSPLDLFQKDSLYAPPMILIDVTFEMNIMKEEIFGPILPVIFYDHKNPLEVRSILEKHATPLVTYVFSPLKSDDDKKLYENIQNEQLSGALVLNNVMSHLSNSHLPFGGVGQSGIGSYHGEYGFRCFSHEEARLETRGNDFLWMIYPPYNSIFHGIALKLSRWFK